MRRGLRWTLLLAVVIGGLVFAAPASAGTLQRFIIGGEHVAAAADGQGLVVHAVGPGDCGPPDYCSVNEPFLGDFGTLVGGGPYSDCMHEFHYHGILFGREDPDPDHCGWGEAVRYAGQPPDVTDSAEAITDESKALETNNPTKGKRYTGQALDHLSDLRRDIWKGPGARVASRRRGTNSADLPLVADARDLTAAAKRLFKKAIHAHGKHRRRLVRRAHRKVERARGKTQQVFKHAITP